MSYIIFSDGSVELVERKQESDPKALIAALSEVVEAKSDI